MKKIDITYPDFEDAIIESLRTRIGIEPPRPLSDEEYAKMSEQERYRYQRDIDNYRDWFSTFSHARRSGYRQGLKVCVRNMLNKGFTLEQISVYVKQSTEQLEWLLSTKDEY